MQTDWLLLFNEYFYKKKNAKPGGDNNILIDMKKMMVHFQMIFYPLKYGNAFGKKLVAIKV